MKRKKRSVAKNIRTVVIWIVGTISFAWLVYAVYVAFPHILACTDGWRSVNAVGPFEQHDIQQYNSCHTLNEFGDYLAGSFAPLAFLWLMIAVFIQSQELREQRDAIEAQLEENRAQTKMLRDEQALAKATTKREEFEALLGLVRNPAQIINRGSKLDGNIDDVKFMQKMGSHIAHVIERVVKDLEDGKTLHNGEHVLRNAEEISKHITELVATRRHLKGQNLKIYESCHIDDLSRAIEIYRAYRDKITESLPDGAIETEAPISTT